MYNINRRLSNMLRIFTLLTVLLALRILFLQVFSGGELSKAASAQRMTNTDFEKPRGNIYDRNGIVFTNRKRKVILALQPFFLKGKDAELQNICSLMNINFYDLRRRLDLKKDPILLEADDETKDKILAMGIQGISAINMLERYEENTLAKHVIGYLRKIDQTGIVGIEKYYEDELKQDSVRTISAVTDAKDNLLQGMGYRIVMEETEKEKMGVKLTLDYHIQKIVEDVMEELQITGAVVVENVYNGDIVAMASKPDFDPERIDKYLTSVNKELFNRATASYSLGSIFKIVDAAQALESGVQLKDDYYCKGYVQIGNKMFKCSSYGKGGNGFVDFKKAFAVSCNSYFIDLGIQLGFNPLIRMALRLGMGQATGIRNQGVAESDGNLPSEKQYVSHGEIANLAIGQGEIMATPIQVANLAATIANGGILNQVNIVDSVVDEEGNVLRNIRNSRSERVLSKDVADRIKEMMEEVTVTGTGIKANLEAYGGAAGKTGSAETGQRIGDSKVVHAWFAGYFPSTDPKYAISVFVENGQYGGSAAAPVFAQIAEEIMKKKY